MTTESLFLAAIAAGFFGSGHCAGMCGAVVTLLEQPRLPTANLARRLVYNTGRLACYVLLGTIAAGLGVVLTRIAGLQAGLIGLRVVAGVLVILLALNLLFDLRSLHGLEAAGLRVWRRVAPLTRHVLPASTLPRAFAAGFLWGALPCGLVYAAVAMAAASGSALTGAAVMLAFWAGTLPALLAIGGMATHVGAWSRHTGLRRAGGALLLLAGLLGLALPFRHGGHDGTPVPHHAAAAATTATVTQNSGF